MARSLFTVFILLLLLMEAVQLGRLGDVHLRYRHYQRTKNAHIRSNEVKSDDEFSDGYLDDIFKKPADEAEFDQGFFIEESGDGVKENKVPEVPVKPSRKEKIVPLPLRIVKGHKIETTVKNASPPPHPQPPKPPVSSVTDSSDTKATSKPPNLMLKLKDWAKNPKNKKWLIGAGGSIVSAPFLIGGIYWWFGPGSSKGPTNVPPDWPGGPVTLPKPTERRLLFLILGALLVMLFFGTCYWLYCLPPSNEGEEETAEGALGVAFGLPPGFGVPGAETPLPATPKSSSPKAASRVGIGSNSPRSSRSGLQKGNFKTGPPKVPSKMGVSSTTPNTSSISTTPSPSTGLSKSQVFVKTPNKMTISKSRKAKSMRLKGKL